MFLRIFGGALLCAQSSYFYGLWVGVGFSFGLRFGVGGGRGWRVTRGSGAGEVFFVGLAPPRGARVCRGILRRSKKTIENS